MAPGTTTAGIESVAGAWSNLTSLGGIAGGLAGNFGANLAFGSDRGIGSTIGGTLGAIGGSFIPIPFVGTAAGAFLGNAIGGLFGSKNKNTGAKVSGDVEAGVVGRAGGLLSALGLPTAGGRTEFGSAAWVGNLARNMGEGNIPGSVEGSFNFGIRAILKSSEEFSKLGDVIDRIDFNDTEQALSDVQFALALVNGEFKLTEEEVSEAKKAIDTINEAFEQARETADRLGLATADLITTQEKAIQKLKSNFDKSIEMQTLAIIDPMAFALEELEKIQKERLENARALGANLVEVERLNLIERGKLLEKFAEEETRELRTTLGGVLSAFNKDAVRIFDSMQNIGNFVSGLFMRADFTSPMRALDAARQELVRTLGQADAGIVGALERLPSLAETFLGLSQQAFASGEQFTEDFNFVVQELSRFALGLPGGPGERSEQFMQQIISELQSLGIDLAVGLEAIPSELQEIASLLIQNAREQSVGAETGFNILTSIRDRLDATGTGNDLLELLTVQGTDRTVSSLDNIGQQLVSVQMEISRLPGALASALASGLSSGGGSVMDALRALRDGLNGFSIALGRGLWDMLSPGNPQPNLAAFTNYRFPSFAQGGMIRIGGSGGQDSQIMSARVSPGELVTFIPPGSISNGFGDSLDRIGSSIELTGGSSVSTMTSVQREVAGLRQDMKKMIGEFRALAMMRA